MEIGGDNMAIEIKEYDGFKPRKSTATQTIAPKVKDDKRFTVAKKDKPSK